MSIKVNYKGNEILSYNENGTKTLKTSGKYCEGDISITNTQDGGITPTGQIEITENGTYDVTEKASAVVNVSGGGGNPYEKFNALLSDNITEIVSKDVLHFLPRMCRDNKSLKKVYVCNDNFYYGIEIARAFENCRNLQYLIVPTYSQNAASSTLQIPNYFLANSGIKLNIIYGCATWQGSSHTNTSSFKTLIVTRTDAVNSVASNAFNGSALITTGTIYVPDSLVSGYKSATNWANWADNIKGYSEADNYSSGATYTIGDVCRANGKFYAWVNETDGNSNPPSSLSVADLGTNWYCIAEV